MNLFKKPVARISLAMMAYTVSLLLVADFAGLLPHADEQIFMARKNLCESLSVQFSVAAGKGDFSTIKVVLHSLVKRDNDILSGALRGPHGKLLAVAGDHQAHWRQKEDGLSTLNQVLVPILRNDEPWGQVELRFAPIWGAGRWIGLERSFWLLLLFMAVAGFLGYFILMRRILRELDPSAVVPARVNAAFDVLKEGVLILDEKEQIVMANGSFAAHFGHRSEKLLGMNGSELGWVGYESEQDKAALPWRQVLETGMQRTGVALVLQTESGRRVKFMVNATPVLDGQGNSRGVLATFDDVTELEEKNIQLHQAVTELQATSEEIAAKNEELEFLASHDPMTKLLNRRAFNERFEEMFLRSRQEGEELSCIMCDIDHFKKVNDTYGHAVGDEVIKAVAHVLREKSRDVDLVGRYGGEEFCLVFTSQGLEQAAIIAERIRETIAAREVEGITVTMSFGVSSLARQPESPSELVKQADDALYDAKEGGRNQVVCWSAEGECLEKTND